MGLTQIAASIAAAVLAVVFTRGQRRVYALLGLSLVALYWFQPPVPLRYFDFWLPSLSITLVLLVWFITSQSAAWKSKENLIGLFVIISVVTLIELTRYIFPDPLITSNFPPNIVQYLTFIAISGSFILVLGLFSRRFAWTLSIGTLLFLAILVLLKSPALSLQTSIFFREIANRPIESASALDLRWLGFSYIAFRLIHVLRDKQSGRLSELSIAEFATYVVFFPALSAGPIDRVERFVKDLRNEFILHKDELLSAGQRIIVGLFKKFVIADLLALIALNDSLALQARSSAWMWIHVYAYSFQIFFDFSGYTDIAIGIGRLVGIKLPENFLSPYAKPNLTLFWNNWHMTLTQWFRSYFFNPFNRWMRGFKSIPAWAMILIGQLSTMILIGLWHGITWNFILWGAWHGLGLFIQNRWSDFAKTRINTSGSTRQTVYQIAGVMLTFHFVTLGWVFFALSDPILSRTVLMKLFGMY